MAVTRVNSSAIKGTSTAATAISTTVGVAVAVGDLLVAVADGTGTHVTNGMAMSATGNGAFTTLLETDQGGSSSHWMQTFYLRAAVAMAATDTVTFTPYAGSTANAFAVDIFRGAAGTINRAAVGSTNASSATPTAPALATAPTAGSLVLALAGWSTGTGTPPAAFTAGSSNTTNQSVGIGYVLSADGSSTYGGTWSITTNVSATQTVAFDAAAAAAGSAIRRGGRWAW